jgi:ADP-ribose pyrophosphatase YjhB (NUDIX family)
VTVPSQLRWARALQAVAQSGLAYGEPSQYDRERYAAVRRIAAEMLAGGDGEAGPVEQWLAAESGHATPKLDVRGVVFFGDGVLLVREVADGLWTLPGGWVDVGESPSEAVEREVLEESGLRTRAVKLLALYDRDRQGHPPHPWHTWKAVFRCEPEYDAHDRAPVGPETDAADCFALDRLPELSVMRVTRAQLGRFFEHRLHPEWPTDFD